MRNGIKNCRQNIHGYPAKTGFETDNATKGRGNTDRAAHIGPFGKRDTAGGHGNTCTTGRPATGAAGIKGIARMPLHGRSGETGMGKFGGCCPRDDNRPGFFKPPDQHRLEIFNAILQRSRAA